MRSQALAPEGSQQRSAACALVRIYVGAGGSGAIQTFSLESQTRLQHDAAYSAAGVS